MLIGAGIACVVVVAYELRTFLRRTTWWRCCECCPERNPKYEGMALGDTTMSTSPRGTGATELEKVWPL